MIRLVIIGNGAAGISAAEAMRSVDRNARITIISGEPCSAYSKVLLHYYIDSRIPERSLFIRTEKFYQDFRIDTVLGNKVEAVCPDEQIVYMADRSRLFFDKLLIATGSSPIIPRLGGKNLSGTHTMWTIGDARNIINASEKGRKGVIIGGSFVGMQALDTLKRKGLSVAVMDMADRIMPNILDRTGSGVLEDYLRKKGVKLFLKSSPTEINDSGNYGKTLHLADGNKLNADVCILSVGARPNISLADHSPIKRNVGLVVDPYMRTSCPNIYAAGDVAEVFDRIDGKRKVFGLWSTAVEQGRIAGLNMVGKPVEYSGGMDMNAINILGFPVLTVGKTNWSDDGESITANVYFDERKKVYRKFLIKDDVLVGAILMGRVDDAGRIGSLIRSKYRIDQSDIKFSLGALRDRFNYLA